MNVCHDSHMSQVINFSPSTRPIETTRAGLLNTGKYVIASVSRALHAPTHAHTHTRAHTRTRTHTHITHASRTERLCHFGNEDRRRPSAVICNVTLRKSREFTWAKGHGYLGREVYLTRHPRAQPARCVSSRTNGISVIG